MCIRDRYNPEGKVAPPEYSIRYEIDVYKRQAYYQAACDGLGFKLLRIPLDAE